MLIPFSFNLFINKINYPINKFMIRSKYLWSQWAGLNDRNVHVTKQIIVKMGSCFLVSCRATFLITSPKEDQSQYGFIPKLHVCLSSS